MIDQLTLLFLRDLNSMSYPNLYSSGTFTSNLELSGVLKAINLSLSLKKKT